MKNKTHGVGGSGHGCSMPGPGGARIPRQRVWQGWFLNMDPTCLDDASLDLVTERKRGGGLSMTNYERSQYFRKVYGSKRLKKRIKRLANHIKIDNKYLEVS